MVANRSFGEIFDFQLFQSHRFNVTIAHRSRHKVGGERVKGKVKFRKRQISSPIVRFIDTEVPFFGRQIVWYFAATGKTSAMRDTPHVRHGILIRWECWPTAKRPQRFLNTRRKCLASVPASFRNWGWSLSCAGSKEGATRKRYHERSWVSVSS